MNAMTAPATERESYQGAGPTSATAAATATAAPTAEHAAFLALLSAARDGDQRAVEDLAAQMLPQIAAYVRKRGAQEPDALASQVMLEFLRSLDRLELRSAQQLWRYLYRIAHSRVIDERRRVRPDTSAGEPTEMADSSATSFDERVVDKMFVGDLLDQLNDDQREVIEMRFLEDCSIEETANRTGRTLPAVKGLQRRAIRALAVAAGVTFSIVALAIGSASWLSPQQAEVVTATAPPPPADGTSPATLAPTAPLDEGNRQSGIAVLIETGPDVEITLPDRATLSVDLPQDLAAALEWRQMDGPATAVLYPQADGTVHVELPVAGVYTFQVAGDVGGSQPGSGQVTVTARTPRPTPTAVDESSANAIDDETPSDSAVGSTQPLPPNGGGPVECSSENTISDESVSTTPGIERELGPRLVNRETSLPAYDTADEMTPADQPTTTIPAHGDCPPS